MHTILLGRAMGGPSRVPAAREEGLVVVGAEGGGVDARAVLELEAGPLPAGVAESDELHVTSTPPSMGKAWPVMNAASSEQRYSASCATSSGVPMRPSG